MYEEFFLYSSTQYNIVNIVTCVLFIEYHNIINKNIIQTHVKKIFYYMLNHTFSLTDRQLINFLFFCSILYMLFVRRLHDITRIDKEINTLSLFKFY